MANKKNELTLEQYMKIQEKYLPADERILSGGYNMQNPKWMAKKKKATPKKSEEGQKTSPKKTNKKSTTLFGI